MLLILIVVSHDRWLPHPSAHADPPANGVYENAVDVQVSEPQLTLRPKPLRDFPVEQVLDVTDFGVVADDEGNDEDGSRGANPGRGGRYGPRWVAPAA